MPRTIPPPTPPWVPAPFEPADAAAIRALAAGQADADQQRRALRWIVERGAGVYQPTYFPSDRDSAFAEGKRAVGLRIVTIVNMPAELLARMAEV